MTDTVAFQKRISQIGSYGGAEYRVETYISDRGDLPDSGAFLLEIVDVDDPTLDVLARVSTVADITAYIADRVQAVRNGDRFFRSAATTVTYTDLNVARTAVAVLEDFINRLVVAINDFNSDFSTLGITGPPADHEELTFPLVTAAIEEVLTTDYVAKKVIVADTTTALTAKEVSCASIEAALSAAATSLAELKQLQTTLGDLDTQLTASVSALGSVLTSGEYFAGQVDAGIDAYMVDIGTGNVTDPGATSLAYFKDPDRDVTGDGGTVAEGLDTFNTNMRTGRAELSTLNQRVRSLTVASASVTSQVSLKEAAIAALEADGEACASEKRVLAADLAAAQVELQQAGEAIQAVCPDLDLDSIETT